MHWDIALAQHDDIWDTPAQNVDIYRDDISSMKRSAMWLINACSKGDIHPSKQLIAYTDKLLEEFGSRLHRKGRLPLGKAVPDYWFQMSIAISLRCECQLALWRLEND